MTKNWIWTNCITSSYNEVDIFLGFTQCKWNCVFCRRGESLVYFPRAEYNDSYYKFVYYASDSKIDYEFFQGLWKQSNLKINISWNEPLSWDWLDFFITTIRNILPQAIFVLRISNTFRICHSITKNIDRIEFSIYGPNQDIHNKVVWNRDAWNILQNNISVLKDNGLQNSIFFQTIVVKSNIHCVWETIKYITSLTTYPVKIVYPYFFPVDELLQLPQKSEILKEILLQIDISTLKSKCIMVNFSMSKKLESLFYWVIK